MTTHRRDFLKYSAGALAGLLVLPASRRTFAQTVDPVASSRNAFPQGVASGDPQPDAVLLWSRVEPLEGEVDPEVVVQVARSAEFGNLVLEETLTASPDSDHTLRVLVRDLQPDTTYFYRFIAADGATSRLGRTWTAPPLDARRPVSIAFVSCQSWPPNEHGVYQRLIRDERIEGTDRAVDLILHLGDYVYGLPADPEESFGPPSLADSDAAGGPPGMGMAGMGMGGPPSADEPPDPEDFDLYLAEHRRIYKGYLQDSDLQEARAMYPFVAVWDDHEFGNDVWQSYSGGRSNPKKRTAATQAWFEFVPQVLTDSLSVPGVDNEARDYEQPAALDNAPMRDFDDGFLSMEPNNLAAINSQTCYRTVRWGAYVDLLLTDNRSYRGPSAHPGYSAQDVEGEQNAVSVFTRFSRSAGGLPPPLAEGRDANGGNPPETVTINGETVPNPRRDDPAVSLLGNRQKQWFKNALAGSQAIWKVWANAEPVMGFRFDADRINPEAGSGFLWTDSWDGFPNEREEVMQFIRENGIANVVSLSGDRHAHYAGLVAENYEAEAPRYVIPDFTCAAISAFERGPFLERAMGSFGLSHLGMYDRQRADGTGERACNLNLFMRKGARCAQAMSETNDLEQALAAAEPSPNPHLAYADNDVHGYCVATFDSDSCDVTFVSVARPVWDPQVYPEGPPMLRAVGYRVDAWEGGGEPKLVRTFTRGERVFGES